MEQVLFTKPRSNQNKLEMNTDLGQVEVHLGEDCANVKAILSENDVIADIKSKFEAVKLNPVFDTIENSNTIKEGIAVISPAHFESEALNKENQNNIVTKMSNCDESLFTGVVTVPRGLDDDLKEEFTQVKSPEIQISDNFSEKSETFAPDYSKVCDTYEAEGEDQILKTGNVSEQPKIEEFLNISSYCCRSCESELPFDEIAFRRHHQNCSKWLNQMGKAPEGDIRETLFRTKKNIFSCHLCAFKHSGSGKFNGCFSSKYDQSRHEWKKHRHCKIGGNLYLIPHEMYDMIQKSSLQNSNRHSQDQKDQRYYNISDETSVKNTLNSKHYENHKNASLVAQHSGDAMASETNYNHHDYDDSILCDVRRIPEGIFYDNSKSLSERGVNSSYRYSNSSSQGSPKRSQRKRPHLMSNLPYDSRLMSIVTNQIYPYHKKQTNKRKWSIRDTSNKESTIYDKYSNIYYGEDGCKKTILKSNKRHSFRFEYNHHNNIDDTISSAPGKPSHSMFDLHNCQHNPLIKQVKTMSDSDELLEYLIDIDAKVMESLRNGSVNKTLFPLASNSVQKLVVSWCRSAKLRRPEMKSLYSELSRALYRRDATMLKYINLNSEPGNFHVECSQNPYKNIHSTETRFDKHQALWI